MIAIVASDACGVGIDDEGVVTAVYGSVRAHTIPVRWQEFTFKHQSYQVQTDQMW
jgi:hypothetical protein